MAELLKPDICVIGAGSAGLTLAAAAAGFGVSVVLIEKGEMGGDCLNYGCVPSKALLAAAKRAHEARGAGEFGIRTGPIEVDFASVNARINQVIGSIAPNDSAERFAGLGVKVIRAAGQFKDKRTVLAGDYEIQARRFVIAAGSSPSIPPVPGIDCVPYLTNETVFQLKRCPGRLVILGGGPIGIELGQALRRLGSEVTVIEPERVMGKDDPELAALLVQQLRAEGIVIKEGAKPIEVGRFRRTGVRVRLQDGTAIMGSHLLVATGRKPNTESLNLQAARIASDGQGIFVNSKLRTSNSRVYAIGDIARGFQFTHWGNYQAGLALRSILFRFGGSMDRNVVPWTTFTDPELAHVGLSEREARGRHGAIRVLRWPFSENDRAQAEGTTAGHVKVIATKRGRIVGVDILGPHAGELISTWAVAIASKATLQTVASVVMPYPTLSEAGKRAAISYYAPKARARSVRGIVNLLRRFG